MSGPSFVVYIDESGDEGFVFNSPMVGSSHWFVLSAVITRKHSDIETVKLVDDVRGKLKRTTRNPLHFRRMKHEHRLPYVEAISSAQLRIVSVLVHKPSLQERETFQDRYKLYFYATRLLLERVSWICRDHRRDTYPGDGSARVIFSNRASMSYEELRGYLRLLKRQNMLREVQIDWSAIDPERVRAVNHRKLMGLQIADAVATAFYFAVQTNTYGFTEPRYARMLKPVVYHHNGRYLGYGMKFWPKETDALPSNDENLKWVRETYYQ